MNRRKPNIWICGLLLVLTLGGCVSLERAYPDRRYFVIEAPRGAASPNPTASGVLLVTSLRVSPRYESKSLIYRRSESVSSRIITTSFWSRPVQC